MPSISANGTELHYTEKGSGEETIVFSHGLLMSSEMFRAQIDELSSHYRCIAYDHRGQGKSAVADDGYDMDNVAKDAAELIEKLDVAPCHFVGLSMGGFVGMRLAIHRPELLKSLVLMDTSADPEPNVRPYRIMAFIGRWLGFRLVISRVMNLMFGRTFLGDDARAQERDHWRTHVLNNDRKGITRAAHGVIDRDGVYEQLDQVQVPTLVIVGEEDIATVPAKAQRIQKAIRGSKLVTIPQAGHSASIEQAELVTQEIKTFFIANR